MRPLCIYHGNCADGFGAAWVVWRYYGGLVDLFPGVYQKDPPDVSDRHVIMVDFSYKREVMLEMAEMARTVLVLDHHKTAREDLKPDGGLGILAVERERTGQQWQRFCDKDWDPDQRGVFVLFDMDRSGAGIAWDFFNPDEKRPTLLNHIEDRDLWRFKLKGTREIQATLFSYPYDMELWDRLINDVNMFGTEEMVTEGTAIERKHHKDLDELLRICTRPMRFKIPNIMNTLVVPAANLPYTMVSDAGNMLCRRTLDGQPTDPAAGLSPVKHPFAACYYDGKDGRNFSLRSEDEGADVSAIAKLYGGGGHAHAAGFRVPYAQLAQFEP